MPDLHSGVMPHGHIQHGQAELLQAELLEAELEAELNTTDKVVTVTVNTSVT